MKYCVSVSSLFMRVAAAALSQPLCFNCQLYVAPQLTSETSFSLITLALKTDTSH